MAEFTLDRKDRLILANQYRILMKIDPDEGDFYQRSLKILEHGYELEYESLAAGIYEDTMSEEECEEVYAIIEMFRRLNYSYEQLGDKGGIEPDRLRFWGFDGNNEWNYLAYGKYLNSLGKYEESQVVNSHRRSLEIYRRMLAEFEPLKAKEALDKADIQRFLAAMIHPSNRT